MIWSCRVVQLRVAAAETLQQQEHVYDHNYQSEKQPAVASHGCSNHYCSKGGSQAKKYSKLESFQLFRNEHEHLLSL